MKKYLIPIAFASMLQFFTCYGMETMVATVEIITTDMIERLPATVVVVQQSYVTGGVVITYPTGTFTQNPTISLAVEDPSHVPTVTYTAEISANSPTSSTVMVFKTETGGIIVEASTGEVTVHFVAVGT